MLRILKRIPHKNLVWKKLPYPILVFNQPLCYNNCPKVIAVQPVRKYSNQYSKDDRTGGGLWVALGALVLTGGATLAYAKYDSDFRKTLGHYAPFTDDVIKTMWSEEGSGNIILDSYNSIKSSVLQLVVGDKSPTKLKMDVPKPPEQYKAPPAIVPKLEELKKKEPVYSEIRLETIDKKGEEPTVELVGSVKPAPEQLSDEDATKLAELEAKICESAEAAVNAYNNAVYIVKRYNQDIEYIIDEAVNEINPQTWDSVKKKTRSKFECVKRAEEKAEEATQNINKLKALVSRSTFDAPPSTKEMIKNNISKVQEDIEKAKKELEHEQKVGNVAEKYWDKVEKARQHFSEELESLFPTIDLSKKQLSMNAEDLDLFVLHCYANILYYQKELAKLDTIVQEKLRSALDAARRGGYDVLNNTQICEALEQEKRRLSLCFQQQVLKLRRESELELREQLKRQSQAFTDHLEEAINIRVAEIMRKAQREFEEKLENEKLKYKTELARIVGRLQGLESAVKEKNETDAASRKAQVLWSACQALLRAIKTGCPGLPWKDQLRPLSPELQAVQQAAAENDELVMAVINGIPKEAKERGVFPEDALRERFLKVEKVARTVALVPEDGAALPIHILSFIQSLLLINAASPIPQCELNDEKVDFSKLNTNDILQRARYWLDRGDFAQTLRYMNLLKGAPRCIARQWMEETRILLETQQAANTLMAHASSSGLIYL